RFEGLDTAPCRTRAANRPLRRQRVAPDAGRRLSPDSDWPGGWSDGPRASSLRLVVRVEIERLPPAAIRRERHGRALLWRWAAARIQPFRGSASPPPAPHSRRTANFA